LNSRFDPLCLGRYPSPRPLLHLQFGERVYRYAVVDDFGPNDLDPHHRMTQEEMQRGETHASLHAGYGDKR